MPQCDVCLAECVDVGVLACRHVLCRSCGMSQSKCLVCAGVGRHSRRRLGKHVTISCPTNVGRVEDVVPRDISKESTPEVVEYPPSMPYVQSSLPTPPSHSPPPKARRHPTAPQSPAAHIDSIQNMSPLPAATNSNSATGDNDAPKPPVKIPKKELSLPHDEKPRSPLKTVHGPTAFDEVRCELRVLGTAPKLQRPALRTTGKLSVALLSRFVHQTLNLPESETVVLRCSGEDLTDAMTLGHLVTYVWPESEGHMILDYRIASHPIKRDTASR